MRAIVLSVVLVASPALAQQSPATIPPAPSVAAPSASSGPPAAQVLDPLADLIQQSGQDMDEEQAETAAPRPAPRRKPNILPIPAPGETTPAEQVYEMRVRGSIAAAQNLQGPLDGQWRIAGPDGTPLYALQIVDKAGGGAPLEGAWRDLRRTGAPGSTGLIDDLQREGEGLSARFSAREGGQASILTLSPDGDGWRGQLVEDGASRAVAVEHLLPEAPPGYEARGARPYVWPPRAASGRTTSAKPAVCSTKGKKGKALKAAKAKCAAASKGKASTLKKGKASKAKGKKVSSRKKKR